MLIDVKEKKKQVLKYMKEHPEKTLLEISSACGTSMLIINWWLNSDKKFSNKFERIINGQQK